MLMEATLCTGKKVRVREVGTEQEEIVLKVLGSGADLQSAVTQKGYITELIKMMIVEVDGKKMVYADLQKLDEVFNIKEIRQLEALYNELHVPSDSEMENFLKTLLPVSMGS